MTEIELKAAFAASLLREPNPMQAALLVVDDTAEALRMAMEWAHDPYVTQEVARLRDAGEAEALLPSKAEAAYLAWQMAKAPGETKDRIAALKLFGDFMDYLPKGTGNTNTTNVLINRVMEVQRFASDEEWEIAAERQQKELINVSDKRH